MGKGWFFIILLIVIIGSFFYYKPVKTKEVIGASSDMVGSIVKDKWDSREQNLGKPSIPCETNEDCDIIIDCENLCVCSLGNCYKNFKGEN